MTKTLASIAAVLLGLSPGEVYGQEQSRVVPEVLVGEWLHVGGRQSSIELSDKSRILTGCGGIKAAF